MNQKKNFSFWVCSFEFLKEALQCLGYKEARLIKKKKILFSEDDKIDKASGSSSESFDDKTTLDIDLVQNEVRVHKNPFNLEKTFEKSQKIFNPVVSNENLGDYFHDLILPKNINESNFVCNKNYLTLLNKIFNNNYNNHFYFYNANSGITLCLLQIFEHYREINQTRYFHFNCEYLNKYKKEYIYFKLAKLFKKEEKELYKDITNNIENEIKNYNIQGILTYIIKNLDNVYIIFDNIKVDDALQKILSIIINLQHTEGKKKFTIFKFIQINSETLNSIPYLNYFSTIFPNENSYKQDIPVYEFAKTLSYDKEEDKIKCIEAYKDKTKLDISRINDNSIDYLIFIFKLLHHSSYMENNDFLDYNYKYLIKYLPYLYIYLYNDKYIKCCINNIQFKGNFIKEIIYNTFIYLMSEKMITQDIFRELKNKSTEGIYLEKELIYYLVTKNIEFDKIKIDKIYCFNYKLEANITKSEIIFIQDDERAPIYDFGIIIDFNGELIFKGYQIGINKPKSSLSRLSKKRIKIDILYFISKINNFLKKKITKFSFGIITTANAYYSNLNNKVNVDDEYIEIDDYNIIENSKKEDNESEYKNYKIMKNHCNENNFEFIIFDPKKKEFYIDEGKSGLNIINFKQYFNPNTINSVTNYIFNNENNSNIIKIPLYANEIKKSDINYIYEQVTEIKDNKLDFIGKFGKEKNEEKVEVIRKINFDNLVDNKYLIYAKDKNKEKTIFYNKKYYCNDYKDFEVFYVFDTSLKIKKKDNKKNKEKVKDDNSMNNILTFTDISNPYKSSNINDNMDFIGRKRNFN